jgi:2,3-bisphosphoglycerate-dependent phosphoglycerate mutase
MYGDLQGLNKRETMDKYGEDQVHIWRRSYDVPPPHGECLADTAARAIPYFEKQVLPLLKEGKNVFISAHGNSLRAIIMKLDNLSKEQVLNLELATGLPVIYEYTNGSLRRTDG